MTYLCFDTRTLDLDAIARDLYDPEKIGCISIKDFLFQDFRNTLCDELRKGPFARQQQVYKNAQQDLCFFFVEQEHNSYPNLALLHRLYEHVHGVLARKAGFQEKTKSCIAVHKYDEGSIGITSHKDERKYANLISIFILAGSAPFCVYRNKQEKVGELDAQPGNLILLRAPRSRSEDNRPIHSIGPVVEERYSICFRESFNK